MIHSTIAGAITGTVVGGFAGGITSGIMALATGGSFSKGFSNGIGTGMVAGGVLGAFSGFMNIFSLANIMTASGGPCAGQWDKVAGGIVLVLFALIVLKKMWDLYGDDVQDDYDKHFKKDDEAQEGSSVCGGEPGVYS